MATVLDGEVSQFLKVKEHEIQADCLSSSSKIIWSNRKITEEEQLWLAVTTLNIV